MFTFSSADSSQSATLLRIRPNGNGDSCDCSTEAGGRERRAPQRSGYLRLFEEAHAHNIHHEYELLVPGGTVKHGIAQPVFELCRLFRVISET